MERRRCWEHASGETFNSRQRDQPLNREGREPLKEAKALLGNHRLDENHRRPRGSLDHQTSADFAAASIEPGVASAPPGRTHSAPQPALL